MSTTITRIGVALAALVAAAAIAVSAHATPPASGSAMNPACHDFMPMYWVYVNAGDEATASALLSNLRGMGCFDDLIPQEN